MKIIIILLVIGISVAVNISAQSNSPMATILGRQEETPAPIPEQEVFIIRFNWETPQRVTVGERVTLTLRANSSVLFTDGNMSAHLPSAFLMPEVPQGVILSQLSLSAEEKASGIIIKLQLIPLAAGDFYLPERIFQQENTRFEIPALNIQVVSRVQ